MKRYGAMGGQRRNANMGTSRHPHLNLLRGHRRAHAQPRWVRVLISLGLSVALVGTCYVGLLYVGFYAVKFHVTDVSGTVDPNSDQYNQLSRSLLNIPLDQLHLPTIGNVNDQLERLVAAQEGCQLAIVQAAYPVNATKITAAKSAGADHDTLVKMAFAVGLRASDQRVRTAIEGCLSNPDTAVPDHITPSATNVFPWAGREEWSVAAAGFTKDRDIINHAAQEIGIEPRTIVAAGFVEQMRLYFTQRELYEKFFQPLKILGNATQFAWGVMAIKEATAIDVERHLKTTASSYYLGADRSHLLDFTSDNHDAERLARLTDEDNHYYSYLYGGLELEQFITQWQKAGYDIRHRPEILATLYNIGFSRSKPNTNPQVGGSTLTIADTPYTFGALAFEFYYSGELLDVFPYSPASS